MHYSGLFSEWIAEIKFDLRANVTVRLWSKR